MSSYTSLSTAQGESYQVHLDAFVVGSLGTWDPKTIAYCLSLGLVRSTGPCSKSSAAGMPSPEAMKCGLLGAGDTSSGAPPAKFPLDYTPAYSHL